MVASKKPNYKQIIQIAGPIAVILILLMMFIIYELVYLEKPNENLNPEDNIGVPENGIYTCVDLGCPNDTMYVGSSQSNVYHECTSGYALAILPNNLICFSSAEEAEAQGYKAAAK